MDDIENGIRSLREDSASGSSEIALKASKLIEHATDMISSVFDPAIFAKAIMDLGIEIINAQPSMAPLFNLVNEVFISLEKEGSILEMKERIKGTISEWRNKFSEANHKIAISSLKIIEHGFRVATYSWSSTVINCLFKAREMGKEFRIITSEGRPGMEGLRVAKAFSEKGVPVTLVIDAALPGLLRDSDIVLVGADAVTSNGILNKVGTFPLAITAKGLKKPFYCLCGTDKFLPPEWEKGIRIEEKDPGEILHPPISGVEVYNFYFELTPLDDFTGIVTEKGILNPDDVREELRKKRISVLL
jgi:translation initiation factor 2B subunit (eIF-2B alpha/beta/delta family)